MYDRGQLVVIYDQRRVSDEEVYTYRCGKYRQASTQTETFLPEIDSYVISLVSPAFHLISHSQETRS